MAIMSRTRRILDLTATGSDETVAFSQADDDSNVVTTYLTVERSTWADLGSPTQVTITIEPGDNLTP